MHEEYPNDDAEIDRFEVSSQSETNIIQRDHYHQ